MAISADEVNWDLGLVRLWAWQWKMHCNEEKTEEVIFSTMRIKSNHPPLMLGGDKGVKKTRAQTLWNDLG